MIGRKVTRRKVSKEVERMKRMRFPHNSRSRGSRVSTGYWSFIPSYRHRFFHRPEHHVKAIVRVSKVILCHRHGRLILQRSHTEGKARRHSQDHSALITAPQQARVLLSLSTEFYGWLNWRKGSPKQHVTNQILSKLIQRDWSNSECFLSFPK